MDRFFAIVNPAAGGGRSAKLAGPALARLREKGLKVDVIASTCPGHALQLAREAYDQGYRRFLAVGGDGTAHEILNGVFAGRSAVQRITLGFLPLGTGNSFLRDFTKDGAAASMQALLQGRSRTVDLLRLTHATGEIYSFNLLSVGFTADVAALTNRMFKPFGDLGYLLGVFVRVVQLRWRSLALRCDDDQEWDERRALFLTFNNSLPRLYDGSHVNHPLASRRAVRHVEFKGTAPVDIMIDGEVLTLECRALDILPAAVDICI